MRGCNYTRVGVLYPTFTVGQYRSTHTRPDTVPDMVSEWDDHVWLVVNRGLKVAAFLKATVTVIAVLVLIGIITTLTVAFNNDLDTDARLLVVAFTLSAALLWTPLLAGLYALANTGRGPCHPPGINSHRRVTTPSRGSAYARSRPGFPGRPSFDD